jgi:hypothetical protein
MSRIPRIKEVFYSVKQYPRTSIDYEVGKILMKRKINRHYSLSGCASIDGVRLMNNMART